MSVRFHFQSLGPQPLWPKKAVPGTAQDIFVLDSAFVLIEGTAASAVQLSEARRPLCESRNPIHFRRPPRTRRPLAATARFLVSDVIRKEISENREKSQSRNAVSG